MPQTLFDGVRGQLLHLIPRFGLCNKAQFILEALELICGASLRLPPGAQRPEACRLNRDGTAIQFSLALTAGLSPRLQFLGEAGAHGLDAAERAAVGLETMEAVARLAGAREEFREALPLLREMTPEDLGPSMGSGPGVYWIGVSFPPAGEPAMTAYVNARFGDEPAQWERAGRFAASFGRSVAWERIEAEFRGRLAPLGVAMTLAAGRPPSGRIYCSAYGLPFLYYQQTLPQVSGDSLSGELLDRYVEAMIGGDRNYPSQSAVCSVEFDEEGSNVKFELCAHCAFATDAEASARCGRWLDSEGLDAGLYRDTIRLLGGARGTGRPELHAYVGVGARRGEPYSTFYLNPGPGLAS